MARSVRTLPLASVSGGYPEFLPTNQQWKQIEQAYGHALTDVRQAIITVTINFLLWEPFERAAESVLLARKEVLKVQKAAKNLHGASVTARATAATFYAHRLIKRHLADEKFWSRKFGGRNSDEFVQLRRLLALVLDACTSVLDACTSALAELDDPNQPGHREGDCWRDWVRALTRIAKQNKLPSHVGNDPDPDKASAFVVLVHELQLCMKPEARRYMHSTVALAQAINRARRDKARVQAAAPSRPS
jgi:hypothetical protein